MKFHKVMLKSLLLFMTGTCLFAAAEADALNRRFLDFRHVKANNPSSDSCWTVSASPELGDETPGAFLVINIGNSQTRLLASDIVGNRVELRIKGTLIHGLQSSRWSGSAPQGEPLFLHVISIFVDGIEVVSWTKFLDGSLYITHNFRVYLGTDVNTSGSVLVTDYYTKKAFDNLFISNCHEYCHVLSGNAFKYPEEERFLRSVVGPVWLALTEQEGFIAPKELIFPTIDELIDQKPVATAKSVSEYVDSQEPVWKLPFLLPPLIEIKPGIDRDQAMSGLKTLQREVTLSVIKSGGASFSSDRMICNEKLLKYYLEVIDESSPLHDRIEANLMTVRKEVKSAASRFSVGGTNFNTGIIRAAPVRKQQAIPAEPVEHDGSGK